MVVPLLGLLLGLVVQTGLLLTDVVMAQGIAREVGRAAAVHGDEHARQIADRLAGDRDVQVDLSDDRGFVVASITLDTPAFDVVGVRLTVPASAAFRRETPPAVGTGMP